MLHVFIINSFAGTGGFFEKVRNEIEKITDMDCLIFNSEYPGHECILATQIYDLFKGENIRIYSCGGSGTFRNIMKGLPSYKNIELVELPYGMTNDFQAVFGEKREMFGSLLELIHGKAVKIDYIESNLGPVHNTLSAGFDVTLLRIANKLSRLPFSLGGIIYAVAGICALFVKSNFKAEILIDGVAVDENNFEQITIANGRVLGGTFHVGAHNDPCDGMMDVLIVPRRNFLRKIGYFISLIGNNQKYIEKHCIIKKGRQVEVKMLNNTIFSGNFDGEIESGEYLTARIGTEEFRYIIPERLDFKEAVYEK